MSREEALADRRRSLMENVLDSPLPPDRKIRLYESTLARRLNEEEKLIDTPVPPPQDVVLAEPPMAESRKALPEPLQPMAEPRKALSTHHQDTYDNFNADLFDPLPEQSSVKSASWHVVTPKRRTPKDRRVKLPSPAPKDRRATLPPPAPAPKDDRRATLATLPSYMQPLNRKKKTDPSDASPATLRPNRPPVGHFKGKGRLSVVRW